MEQRNMSKYCKFHKDKGHDTTECFQLHDQIEALILGGYLQEYISGLVTAGRSSHFGSGQQREYKQSQ